MNFKQEAETCYRAALQIKSKYAEGQNWLKEDLVKFGQLVDTAIENKKNGDRVIYLDQWKRDQESKFNALPVATRSNPDSAESLKRFVVEGKEMTQRLFNEGDPGLGGSAVTPHFESEVIAALPAVSKIRGLVDVRQAKSNPVVVPRFQENGDIYSSTYTGSWKAEGQGIGENGAAQPTQANPATGSRSFYLKTWAPDLVVITRELIQDAASFETDLINQFISTLGPDLESAYLNGDGILQPRGIMTYANAGVTRVTLGTAAITYNGLVDLAMALPSQYAGVFIMNRNTYAAMLKLAGSTNDHPLFQAGMLQQKFLNRDIILSDFMPDIGAAKYPILHADLRFYRAYDRLQSLEISRLVERFAPHIALQPYGRFAGDVAVFNAFRVGYCS